MDLSVRRAEVALLIQESLTTTGAAERWEGQRVNVVHLYGSFENSPHPVVRDSPIASDEENNQPAISRRRASILYVFFSPVYNQHRLVYNQLIV